MIGDNGANRVSWFIRHLQMKRALGLPYRYKMWPARQMRGRDRRRGTWWNRKQNCIAIEGVDFAQDTLEGGADEFELILDSDEGVAEGSSLLSDDEYVPETEPQDVTVSTITGPCANKGLCSTMLHEWRRIISDMENESGKVDMERSKVQMDSVKLEESAKVEMDSDQLGMCAKVQMDSVKLEMDSVTFQKESAKAQMDNVKLEKESAKVEMDNIKLEMDSVNFDKESAKVEMDNAKVCSILLREWHRIISDQENKSGKVDMESTKAQMDNVKLEKESEKVEMDNIKLEMDSVNFDKESAKVEMDNAKVCSILLHEWHRIISDQENKSGKVDMESAKVQMQSDKMEMCAKVQMDSFKLEMDSVKMDTGKEVVDHRAYFSDIDTDDEACWVQDGVDLRGHSQVEDDDFTEQGLLIVFIIRVGQLFIK